MVCNINNVIRDVRVCLDQNMSSEQLLQTDDVDTLSLNDIIHSKILEAVIRVHTDAPTYLLEEGHHFGDAIFWNDLESGWVLLPDDFMRLIVFEMSDWESAVYTAISTSDPKYKLQRQRIKALRGTAQKPICAIVNRPEGKALEFYSCRSQGAYVSKATYIPYPNIDNYGGIDICERCYTAVINCTASLVSGTYGDTPKAEYFSSLYQSMLQQ